jgi:hypothetical protein
MKISVSQNLSVGDVAMKSLSVSALRRALGDPKSEEKIAMHGGGVRRREIWDAAGIATLRDVEDEAVCLIVDPLVADVAVDDEPLPNTEREFLKAFPTSMKGLGHSYVLLHSQWRLDVDFTSSKKRRGAGSTTRHLSRVAIALKKEAQQVGMRRRRGLYSPPYEHE